VLASPNHIPRRGDLRSPASWDSEWRGAVQVWVAVTVAGAGAVTEAVAVVGRGDLRSPMWFGPRRCQGWVRRQRMARMESSRASAGVTVA
jgi:hypothetical protein